MTNNYLQSDISDTPPISETHEIDAISTDRELSPRAIDLAETHPEFIEALASGPIDTLPSLEKRDYQSQAREAIRTKFLDGQTSGLLEIGTGGGKTAIAFNFLHKLPGKVLWLAPSTAALERALDEAENLKLDKKLQVLNGKGVSADTDILFSTVGMMNYGGKFRSIDPDEFALIIFDEGHHSMGKATRTMLDHFRAYHLYLTATPEMCAGHLHKYAEPFFRYSSEDLIHQDNFPFWVLRRYEVTGEKISESKLIGDNYALAEGEENQVLDMPHRFAITLKILQRNVTAREKTIAFLPSVASSRKFVKEIVAAHPDIAGQVAHVDGSMDKRVVKAIAREFREGRIQAICCNDLFTESLDIPDIRHVLLGDPSRSPRILLQRIGRGARPSPAKTHLTIHDIVSTVPNLSSTSAPLTVAGALGTRKYTQDIVLNGPQKGQVLFEGSAEDQTKSVTFVDATTVATEDIPFNERMIDMSFMANAEFAFEVYKSFAESFDTSVANLILQGEIYAKTHPHTDLELRYPASKDGETRSIQINFSDVLAATRLYQIKDRLIAILQDDLDELCKSFHNKTLRASQPIDIDIDTATDTPTDIVVGIKPLKGDLLDMYERRMRVFKMNILHQSKSINPHTALRRSLGMKTTTEISLQKLINEDPRYSGAWSKLRDTFRDYRLLAIERRHNKPKEYPFRVRKSEIGQGTYYIAKDTIEELRIYKADSEKVHTDPEISKLGFKTDVNFAYHIDKLPQLKIYFDLLVEALDMGITVLHFAPEQIMSDTANFMLFLGILAGDDSFACIEPGIPEFWISDDEDLAVIQKEKYISVGIGHLKLEIDNQDLSTFIFRLPALKGEDLANHRKLIKSFFADVMKDKLSGQAALAQNDLQRVPRNFDMVAETEAKASLYWKLFNEYYSDYENAQMDSGNPPGWIKTIYLFPAQRYGEKYKFTRTTLINAKQIEDEHAEYNGKMCDDALVCILLNKPDVYFAYITNKYPQLTVYFELVAEALSRDITILEFTPDQYKKDPLNFMLFLGTLAGDFRFEGHPAWPEFRVYDGHNIQVSIAHLRLESD